VQEESIKGTNGKRATQDHLFDAFIAALPMFELVLFYDVE